MIRTFLRTTLWTLKAALLGVALAAAVLWPVSHRSPGFVSSTHWTDAGDRAGYVNLFAACDEGRVAVGRYRGAFVGGQLGYARSYVAKEGLGWSWAAVAGPHGYDVTRPSARWGPLGWDRVDIREPETTGDGRAASCPCWLLAVVAGAWPIASFALLVRRRRGACRAGQCPRCGYDLRATPNPAGPSLAVCPECGQRSARDPIDPERRTR